MALTPAVLHSLTKGSDADAWRVIVDQRGRDCVQAAGRRQRAQRGRPARPRNRHFGPLPVLKRLGLVASLRRHRRAHLGSTARWWAEPYSAKAVLILDGLVPA
jgi:hypothetical protein